MDTPVAPPRSVPLTGAESPSQAVDLYDVVAGRIPSSLVVVFVHGGGWYGGNRSQFGEWARHASSCGHRAASLGYRTDEGSSYRDKLDDLVGGLRVVSHAWPDAAGVCLVGSSAGAHLVTALALGGLGAAPDLLPVRAVVSANGPGSMRPASLLQARNRIIEMGMTHDEIDLLDQPVAPGTAPADWLFLLAERETYFPHEHVAGLATRLEEGGSRTATVVVPDTDHGFIYGALSGPAGVAAASAAAMERLWAGVQADAAPPSSHQVVVSDPAT